MDPVNVDYVSAGQGPAIAIEKAMAQVGTAVDGKADVDHAHPEYALASALTALEARVAALETPEA